MSALKKFSQFAYDKVFRRTSTFVVTIGILAIFADRAVDVIAETAFTKINEGRLFKDVRKQLNLDAPK